MLTGSWSLGRKSEALLGRVQQDLVHMQEKSCPNVEEWYKKVVGFVSVIDVPIGPASFWWRLSILCSPQTLHKML